MAAAFVSLQPLFVGCPEEWRAHFWGSYLSDSDPPEKGIAGNSQQVILFVAKIVQAALPGGSGWRLNDDHSGDSSAILRRSGFSPLSTRELLKEAEEGISRS